MTYSGVGRVVPSMVAVSTDATSQKAIRRGTAGRPRAAVGDGSRQSIQGESALGLLARVAASTAWIPVREGGGMVDIRSVMCSPLHRLGSSSLTLGRGNRRHTARGSALTLGPRTGAGPASARPRAL